ncbi:URGCP-MRPS24 readthrough [Homo sapiens]|uniref:URGCP-MRPS24 readthrough n=1 Tax=Homo sapiens TaxID=9606 RepID=S4R325_HUMAN|nr:uncharacterized protein LOC100534592 [Homo sapiens]KAI2545670.1 URGCP-MRPS24 readthrough [Homo sapiens]KAI4013598.1 URGCP-MRPS24 readthrough [Homo sapiens]|eukprot:NP_001191800.1 uncharacterized protein LOC100534592 [Homo sapiens]
MASPGHSDLGEVAPEIKASERRTAVAIADLEWREMEGDDCEFRYGDGTNEAQDNDFPTGAVLEPRAALRLARPAHLPGLRQEPGGPSTRKQGGQAGDLRGGTRAALHRPP